MSPAARIAKKSSLSVSDINSSVLRAVVRTDGTCTRILLSQTSRCTSSVDLTNYSSTIPWQIEAIVMAKSASIASFSSIIA